MEAPAITRHRRPFLAPLWVMAALVLLLAGLAAVAYRSMATTTVVLIRHAEKELGSIEDPPLSLEGEQRAERLARMFGDIRGVGHLDAIYVSDARRTQQTAAPLAARLRMEPVVLPAADIDAAAARLMREHRGGAVLIVGHSNTIPQLVQKIGGIKIPPVAEDDHGQMFVVSVPTLGEASVLRLEY